MHPGQLRGAGRRGAVAVPATLMPSASRKPANACAASSAGVKSVGWEFCQSSASCGAPLGVSRPWSTSSELIGVTLPVVT